MKKSKRMQKMVSYIKKYITPINKGGEIKAYFRDNEFYKAYKLDDSLFKDIEPQQGIVVGIDGSNKEIITTPTYSLQFNRVVGVMRDRIIRSEFISMSGLFIEKGKAKYFLKYFHWDGKEMFDEDEIIVDAYDNTISAHAFISPPEIVSSLLRRFAEWRMVKYVVDEMEEEGIEKGVILRDGSIRMAVTKEYNFGSSALKRVLNSPYSLVGIVKRSSLISVRGINMIKELEMLARNRGKRGRWFYNNIAEIYDPTYPAKIIFAKLHNLGRPLRIEMQKEEKEVGEKLGIVAWDSNDASIGLGYPYTLAKADRESHIKKYEVDEISTSFALLSSDIGEEIELFKDLHDEFKENL